MTSQKSGEEGKTKSFKKCLMKTTQWTIKRRLRWAGHAMRSQNFLLRMVLKQNPVRKKPSGRPKLR
jgi:hypothetical protein